MGARLQALLIALLATAACRTAPLEQADGADLGVGIAPHGVRCDPSNAMDPTTCDPANEFCVAMQGSNSISSCRPLPQACQGVPSCTCVTQVNQCPGVITTCDASKGVVSVLCLID
jgi:hypothetical protein